jgi:hypothetical protein
VDSERGARQLIDAHSQPGALPGAPGSGAGELVEKRVANGRAAARRVITCLVLKLSGGLVQKVDAEQAGGHLALGSEAFKNRPQVTPLRSTRQASVDLCSPGLRPLLGREVLLVRSLDLVGENSPELGWPRGPRTPNRDDHQSGRTLRQQAYV